MKERPKEKEIKIKVNGKHFYCYSCAVEISAHYEKIKPSCVTGVKEGIEIKKELPEDYTEPLCMLKLLFLLVAAISALLNVQIGLPPIVKKR